MHPSERMFQVIVLGGVVLAGGPAGCSGSVATLPEPDDAGHRPDAFPQETAQRLDAQVDPDAFPQEGPAPPPLADAAPSSDGGSPCIFPQETGGWLPDGCAPYDGGFPQETAQP